MQVPRIPKFLLKPAASFLFKLSDQQFEQAYSMAASVLQNSHSLTDCIQNAKKQGLTPEKIEQLKQMYNNSPRLQAMAGKFVSNQQINDLFNTYFPPNQAQGGNGNLPNNVLY